MVLLQVGFQQIPQFGFIIILEVSRHNAILSSFVV